MNTHIHYLLTTVITDQNDGEVSSHILPFNHDQLDLIYETLLKRIDDNFYSIKRDFYIQAIWQYGSIIPGNYQPLFCYSDEDYTKIFKNPILTTYCDYKTNVYHATWNKEHPIYPQLNKNKYVTNNN